MPELPEVQTTVDGINRTAVGRTITDISTTYANRSRMYKDQIKNPVFFKDFKKKVVGHKILKAERRAKNILIHLSGDNTILIHMKMTGHILYGTYKYSHAGWKALDEGLLQDPFNSHIRLVFTLENGKHLVLSDMRKFAKVTIMRTSEIDKSLHLESLGPEPLEKDFNFKQFKSRLLMRPRAPIKKVLMDQTLIAGIGNIYSDEILWRANIHPLSFIPKIHEKNLKLAYEAMKEVLKSGIDMGGDSMSDYRNIEGEKGKFQEHHQAYRRTGQSCTKDGCKGKIERMVIGTRSAHFCPVHQKHFK